MESSLTFYRLLSYLAAGGLAAIALVPPGEVSRGFFRFSALVYAALFAAALAVRPGAGRGLGPEEALFAAAGGLALVEALLAPRLGARGGRALLVAAALAGAGAVGLSGAAGAAGAVDAAGAAGAAGGHAPAGLGALAAILSALLLGSVISAMVLGHWYLVMPRLSPDPLMRLTRLYAASVVLRAAAVIVALALLFFAGGRGFDRFVDGAGFFIWPRILFGIVGPLVLAAMALPTVKVRDTQPATGMLYVACVLVLVGEGIAQYLAVRTGVPV